MIRPLAEAQFRRGGLAGAHLGVDAEVADLAGDQVAILAPGIEDDDLWCGVQVRW